MYTYVGLSIHIIIYSINSIIKVNLCREMITHALSAKKKKLLGNTCLSFTCQVVIQYNGFFCPLPFRGPHLKKVD